MPRRNIYSSLLWLSSVLGCGADPGSLSDGCEGFSLTAGDPRASLAPTRVIVLSSDYQSGSAVSIDLATLRASPLDLLVTGDTVGRVFGSTLALLNRSAASADNLRFYDLARPQRGVCERSLITDAELRAARTSRPYANAHDMLVVDDHRAYVTRYNLPSLAIFDLRLARVTGTLDLSGYKGRAALPHADALALVNNEVWVTLERLDDPSHPTQRGLIVRIDPQTDRVRGVIELPHANPTGPMVASPDGHTRWIVTLGDYHRADDGAVEAVDTDTLAVRSVLGESEVGGNLDGLTALHGNTVLLRVSDAREGDGALGGNRLIAIDLAAPSSPSEWQRTALWSPAIALRVGARVFVPSPGDERFEGTGVEVRDRENRTVAPRIPVGARMRPYDLLAAP